MSECTHAGGVLEIRPELGRARILCRGCGARLEWGILPLDPILGWRRFELMTMVLGDAPPPSHDPLCALCQAGVCTGPSGSHGGVAG